MRYNVPYSIIEYVGGVAYQLQLLDEHSRDHNVFQVSQLRKYDPGLIHVIELEPLQLREDVTYEENPIEILDCRENHFCNTVVSIVKVLWANHTTAEATWKPEEEMQSKYPHLFTRPDMSKFGMKLLLRGVRCTTLEI